MNLIPLLILASLSLALSFLVFTLAQGTLQGRGMRRIPARPGIPSLEGDSRPE